MRKSSSSESWPEDILTLEGGSNINGNTDNISAFTLNAECASSNAVLRQAKSSAQRSLNDDTLMKIKFIYHFTIEHFIEGLKFYFD
jgi:hypothetical protein